MRLNRNAQRAVRGDPHWVTCRFTGKCAKCGKPIEVGEQAFYYPLTRSLMGKSCGHAEEAQADFDSHVFDESNNRSM